MAMSMAYHPQTDGESEQVNQELEVYLRMFCTNQQDKWEDMLHTAEFAHNQTVHLVTKSSPFRLMMGYEPLAIPRIGKGSDLPAVEERMDQLHKAREEALALHELARQHVASRITRTFMPIKVGDNVWLEAWNL